MRSAKLAPACLFALCIAAAAPARAMGVVAVNQPWVRPAGAGAPAIASLVIESSEAVVLEDVRSSRGAVVLREGPRNVRAIDVPAGHPRALQASGAHLVVRSPQPLRLGERVPLTLVLRDAAGARREMTVSAEVRLHSPQDDERHPHAH